MAYDEAHAHDHALGALPSPAAVLGSAWPITLLVAQPPTLDPRPFFHSSRCPRTVDQDGVGACVTFSGFYVQSGQELTDEGHLLTVANIDPLATYYRVKAETGDPTDSAPGLWPPQLWDSVKARGWVSKDGIKRVITGYYGLGRPSSDPTWLALLQATIVALGPTQLTSSWDGNWFLTDATGYLKAPVSGWVGGHAYSGCGWTTVNSHVFPLAHQTWGAWGHNPIPDHFGIDPRFWEKSGANPEAWHVTDAIDAPKPPPPPEDPLRMTIYTPGPRNVLVDLAVGTPIYKTDGKTALTTLKSGGVGVWSPFATTSAKRCIRVSVGGIVQAGVVATSACKNIRPA